MYIPTITTVEVREPCTTRSDAITMSDQIPIILFTKEIMGIPTVVN